MNKPFLVAITAALLVAAVAPSAAGARARTDPRLRKTLYLEYSHSSAGGWIRDLGGGREVIRRELFQLRTRLRLKPDARGRASAKTVLKRVNGGGDENIGGGSTNCADVTKQVLVSDSDGVADVTLTVGRSGRRLPPITVTFDPGEMPEQTEVTNGCEGTQPLQQQVTWWHDGFDRFYGNPALSRPFAARITKWKPGRGSVIAQTSLETEFPREPGTVAQRGREGYWRDTWRLTAK
jgi:hypothetical protein